MKRLRILISCLVILILGCQLVGAEELEPKFHKSKINLYRDGEYMDLEEEAILIKNRVYINEGDLKRLVPTIEISIEGQGLTIRDGEDRLELDIKEKKDLNGKDAFKNEDLVYIGLRHIAELNGESVNWCSREKSVFIGEVDYLENMYVSDLGFSFRIPESWEGHYEILEGEGENKLSFIHRPKNAEYANVLFTIERKLGDLITKKDVEESIIEEELLGWGNGYTYVRIYPTKMKYPEEYKEDNFEYNRLYKELPLIGKTFEIIEIERPKAELDRHKLVGSTFFRLELPEDWELVKSDNPFVWKIRDGEEIGEIELCEYKSQDLKLEDMDSIYVSGQTIPRKIRLSLKHGNKENLKEIEKTIKLLGDGYTALDYIYTMEDYIEMGGKKIRGSLKSCRDLNNAIVYGEIEAISGEMISLDFDFPRIVPLRPDKNYDLYGVYDFDMNFINKKPDYKKDIYDFIISSSGDVKGIIGVRE